MPLSLSPFLHYLCNMNCLLFRRSGSVLTELGKDQEVTLPAFKPAALRQMAGKVSQPCPPHHFSQQAERTQKQEKRVRYLWSPNFSAGDSLSLGCRALPWVCKSLWHCQNLEAQNKGTGYSTSFIFYNQKEEMPCLSKLMMLLPSWKKSALLVAVLNWTFMGK